MENQLLHVIKASLNKFTQWLDCFGETSQDHQDFFVSPMGAKAKELYYKNPLLGKIAVAPMIFCEAFWPSSRRLFWRRQRLPIADAHYAMGFALLWQVYHRDEYYEKAVHFLNILEKTRCPDYKYFCWGYPFDWETRNGTIQLGTPLITTTPYVYEAFSQVYQIDNNNKWLAIMNSIAEHALNDIKDINISSGVSTCSYTPFDEGGVINASAYMAFLLSSASVQFSNDAYWRTAERNLNFVLQSQLPDGSWYYSIDGERDFIDHFHTCFVLKALVKIERLTGHKGCGKAIEKGIEYYLEKLFDEKGLPKPFSRSPRLTVYRQELYDYAECINLGILLKDRFTQVDKMLNNVLHDLLHNWQKPDGSFCSRKLLFSWDRVPMHRWGQSQIFRSLSLLLYQEMQADLMK